MKVLIVVGSARQGRVADKVADYIVSTLGNRDGVEVETVDLASLGLPFFDNQTLPAMEGYVPNTQAGLDWQTAVTGADRVIMTVAEYNHSYTPVLKNALDHLYKEWSGKPVALVGYGSVGGARAIAALEPVIGNVGIDMRSDEAQLVFGEHLSYSGEIIDQEATAKLIDGTLGKLLA